MRSPAGPLLLAVVAVAFVAGCASPGDLLSRVQGIERSEWAFAMTQLADAENAGTTGKGVVVAVLDTGIDAAHPDLRGVHLAGWKDFVNDRADPYDDNGHGTHVAGILAARPGGTGGAGLRGAAPGVSLLAYKVIASDGTGSDSAVARGIDEAVRAGAAVVTLSLGGGKLPILGSATSDAAKSAVARGVLVVAAAGNDGASAKDVKTPADVEGVIAVGAVDESRRVASFSNRGAERGGGVGPLDLGVFEREDPHRKPELSAPGVSIKSAWPGGQYATADGTSQAAPFVAGALALYLEAHPEWSRSGARGGSASAVETVKSLFMRTASPVEGASGKHDSGGGYGVVQVMAAIRSG